jgi:hypothetical protein
MYQPGTTNAPDARLVMAHFAGGGLVFLSVNLLLFYWSDALLLHYFNPRLLALTHLVVLGWITLIIFGALYQLVPVILQTKLYSEKLGYISFMALFSGSLLLANAFRLFDLGLQMHLAATLLLLGITLFAVNVFYTAAKSNQSTIERDFIQTAVVWLLFTAIAGVLLAINLQIPFLDVPHLELLKLHAHAGMAGWFLQLIIGVGSKLLPMFMVSHGMDTRKLKIAYYAINLGLITLIFGFYTGYSIALIIGGIGLMTGIVLFGFYLREAYQKRVRRVLDTGMRQSLFSFLLLPWTFVPALWLFAEIAGMPPLPAEAVTGYGLLILLGFISGLILGQTYKTLPFIVWLKEYKSLVGKQKTPLPRDLYSESIANWQFRLYSWALPLVLTGIILQQEWLIKSGAVLSTAAATAYLINMSKILFHKPLKNG